MSVQIRQRVYDLLREMPTRGLAAAKQLFWTELNYGRENEPLSRRQWPERARDVLAEDPLILAGHGGFHIIYARLAEGQTGRSFPLSLTAERLVIDQLLDDHPYALFVFSDPQEGHWHLVNVKLDKVAGTSEVPATSTRRLFRRIAIGPHERLRTAAERVAMLDLTTLSPDLAGLSPLVVQQRHDDAFDVEAVTKQFFQRFASLFYRVRDEIATRPDLADHADDLAQTLLDRLLFLYFIQKKGWLDEDPDYLYNRFLDGHAGQPEAISFYGEVVYPLFLALSDPQTNRDLSDRLGVVPFLNGGLFELHMASYGLSASEARLPVSNATFQALFEELLERYNFTISEDSPLDQEVAIDPEMLGKVFESLVLEREHDPDVDLRKATGSYYTPRPVVAFMCREALTEYLAGESGIARDRIATLLDLPPANQMTDAEREELQGLFSTAEAQALKALMLNVRACDPAVGSGAFLVGLLQTITWAIESLDWRLHGDAALARRNYAYDLKKQIIERCLYGVDIQAQAIQICKLRLWLSLAVDYELPAGVSLAQAIRQVPALPNLAYKVRQGDSLLQRLFGQVVQLDVLARDRETKELVEDLRGEKATYFTLADSAQKRRRGLGILELQTALAEKLLEAKHQQLLGYQPTLMGEETAKARRQRQAWEARDRQYEELEARIGQVRKRLAQWRRQRDTRGIDAEELRRQLLGDPDHPTFIWQVDFAEVFQEKGGFDVMIANPPYVRQEKIKHLKEDLKQVYPDIYHGVADIYVYFYAQGLQQLRDDGVLVYISSNKFMRAGYGKTLRRLLGQDVTLRTVIDFGDLPVFEATTYPTVLVMRKQAPDKNHTLQALTVDEIAVVNHLPSVVRERAWPQPQASLRRDGWTLVRPEVLALLRKLRQSGMSLGEYVDGRFYRGLLTGFNKAFVVDQFERDRLISEDPRSAEIIHPWLRGRTLKRWRVEWNGEYLIAIQNSGDADANNPWGDAQTEAEARSIFRESYPVVHDHLTQYESALRKRYDQGKFWWELRACAYYAEFDKPKIIYPHFNTEPNFAYDEEGSLSNDKTYIIPDAPLYLLGLLNSSVANFFLHQICPSVQQGYLEFRTIYIEQIPVPTPSPAQHDETETLVRHLLDAEGEGPHVAARERELNALSYELYELSVHEINLVEQEI
jgi:hypothetical protein